MFCKTLRLRFCPSERRTAALVVVEVKYEMWMRSASPQSVMVVGVEYEISDSVTVVLRAPGEELGSLCWGIRLSQSEPFHIIGQGHLLSSRSGEAFPTNATQLARSSIRCFATLNHLHPSALSFLSSTALHLPRSAFIFHSCVLSVIGYALLRCVIGLRAPRWSHYTSVPNPNEWASCDTVQSEKDR